MPGQQGNYDLKQIEQWREDTFRRRPEDDLIRQQKKQEQGRETDNHRERLVMNQADKEWEIVLQKRRENELADGNYANLDDVNHFFSEFFTELRALLMRCPPELSSSYSERIRYELENDLEARLTLILEQMHDWTMRTEDLKI